MAAEPKTPFLTRPVVVVTLAVIALAAGIGGGVLARNLGKQSSAEHRLTIENMPAEEKAALKEKRDRFAGLAEAEQQQLIDTYAAIQSSPDREQLNSAMLAYYSWLKSLDSYARRNLRDTSLAVATRIDRVSKTKLEQVSSTPLSPKDVEYLAEWVRKNVLTHVKDVPPEEYDSSPGRTLALAFAKWINHEPSDPAIPEPTVEMYSELSVGLGIQREFEVGRLLDVERNAERKEYIADRIQGLLFNQRGGRGRPGRGGSRLEINQEELLNFLASDRLPKEAKERLANLDLTRQNRLLTYYFLQDSDPDWWKRYGLNRGGRGGRGGRGDEENGRGDNVQNGGQNDGQDDGAENESRRRGAGNRGENIRPGQSPNWPLMIPPRV